MKVRYILAGIIMSAVIAVSMLQMGCATTGGGGGTNVVISPIQASNDVEAATQLGVFEAVQKDPGLVPYFQSVSAGINGILNSGNFDPNQIATIITSLNLPTNQVVEIETGIKIGLGIYQVYFGNVVSSNLNQTQYVEPVLAAIMVGITQGLDPNATMKKFPKQTS